jgi:hypothetical protein
MKNVVAIIGWLLLAAGIGSFIYGIYFAIFLSYEVEEHGLTVLKMPETLEAITTGVGAILLTNLGAMLGISITQPAAKTTRIAFAPSAMRITVIDPPTIRDWIQTGAVLIYVIALVACGIKWASATFKATPDLVVPLISQNSKTLIGVVSAYFAFVLAINSKPALGPVVPAPAAPATAAPAPAAIIAGKDPGKKNEA